MKRKYYLRGIGVGILFATIVLFTANRVTGDKKMTDEEIIERAEALGMVKQESVLENLDKPADTTEMITEQQTEKTTEETSTEEITSEETASQEPVSEEPTTEQKIITLTIVSGMNSWNVATILQDQGVVADASDFDSYLEANGYSSRIVTGDYSIAVGSDYESIANMITGKN